MTFVAHRQVPMFIAPGIYNPWTYIDGSTPVIERPNSAYGSDRGAITGSFVAQAGSIMNLGTEIQWELGPEFDPRDDEHFQLWIGDTGPMPRSIVAPGAFATQLFIAKIDGAVPVEPGTLSTQKAQRGVVRPKR